jgi:hypothetical protein
VRFGFTPIRFANVPAATCETSLCWRRVYGTNPQTHKNPLHIFENTDAHIELALAKDPTYRQLFYGVKYVFKFRTNPNTLGGSQYRLKAWAAGTTEPTTWDVQADGELNSGSVMLISHEADAGLP